ncbi:MAG: glucuronate isomerase [Colwellia sp.]
MTTSNMLIDDNRLFPVESQTRSIAQELYGEVNKLPIISPHGHTDPRWFAENTNFENATSLLLIPDHYVFRMLYSQGVSLGDLGIARVDGGKSSTNYRAAWHIFAKNYHLFHGTPSRLWMDYVFYQIFNIDCELNADSADHYYDTINTQLATAEFKPRALLDKFNIELIATTEGATNKLVHHEALKGTGFEQRVITSFRPDDVIDPDGIDFVNNLVIMAEQTGEDTQDWEGYLAALKKRRAFFRYQGATATDHGHKTARTSDLTKNECMSLFAKCIAGTTTPLEADIFRGQMLTEMAGMSIEDGMVMQIHPGVARSHNAQILSQFGTDKGADIPEPISYVEMLKPLLDKYGNNPALTVILFTLDETTYSRELAPLAGHYPCLKLGPPWWFHDSPEGMLRYRQQITETAGFYNTVGFNDDTRAFLSIPARHDVARRMDCRFLANLVAEHRLSLSQAHELAYQLTYGLVKNTYIK